VFKWVISKDDNTWLVELEPINIIATRAIAIKKTCSSINLYATCKVSE
jgi:hypothetical protein